LTQPRRLDEYTFERFSTSEAQIDHHAFGYFAAHGILAIPTIRNYVERVDLDGDGYRETRKSVREDQLSVLSVDVGAGASALALAGEVPHATAVRRSGYIDDYLYSMSGDSVKVVRADNPGVVIAEVTVAEPPDPIIPGTVPAPSLFPATVAEGALTDAVQRAQAHLAAQTQAASGASMMVTAEAAGAFAKGGYRLVLRTHETQFLYYVRGDQAVLLANDGYVFPNIQSGGAWHAVASAAAAPGDFNFDGTVGSDDLPIWRASYGFDAAGDADGDGDADGADYLVWQRHLGASTSNNLATPADFNADGEVDGADFLKWQRELGAVNTKSTAGADGSGNGVVDADDLAVWKDYYSGNAPRVPAAEKAASSLASHEAAVDALFSGGDFTVLFQEQPLTRTFRPRQRLALT
jgi:hypothetical protein